MSDRDRALDFVRERGRHGVISEDFEMHVRGRNGQLMSHQTGTSIYNWLWKNGHIKWNGQFRATKLGGKAKIMVAPEFLGERPKGTLF